MTSLLDRAADIFRTEGLLPLIRRGFIFLVGYLFRYQRYDLYEHTLEKRDEADFLPKVQDFTFKIITTTGQADELAAAGFKFGSHDPNTRGVWRKGWCPFAFLLMVSWPTSARWP